MVGARQELERYIGTHYLALRRWVSRFCLPVDVDDALQHGLLASIESVDSYEGRAPVGSWLKSVLRFRALEYATTSASRNSRRDIRDADAILYGSSDVDGAQIDAFSIHQLTRQEEDYITKESIQAISDSLSQMDDVTKKVVSLHAKGHTSDDIIGKLRLRSKSVVAGKLQSARAAVKGKA